MSVVLITGAATGIGNLTARALAAAGHNVYASMHDLLRHNAPRAKELLDYAQRHGLALQVVELDVQSQESANKAVSAVMETTGRIDVVVHNAGHLAVGYVEAFTADEVAHLFDINAIGLQRVNRAVLPHMRRQQEGTLLYVGSTTTVVVPPFLGPYVASKFAFDALAMVTAYEVSQFGVETTIIMPGAFTQGTEHFPNASHASDEEVTKAYSALDPMVARNQQATESMFRSGVNPHPMAVAEEITRILALPYGAKPFRSVVDYLDSGVEEVNIVARQAQVDFVTRLGFGELLELKQYK